MSTQFYRQAPDGSETGPFTHEGLRAAVLSGDLTEADEVRSEASTLWVGAGHIKGLFLGEAAEKQPVDSDDARRAAYDAQLEALRTGAYERAEQSRRQGRSAAWWHDPVGWEVYVAILLVMVGVIYSVWETPEHVRFPLPKRMGGPVQQGNFFFGTGPWSTLEYLLLWLDAVVVISGLAFGRMILTSRRK
ncbi:hypothetical protein [Fuerstiella marisgermanici]|uniref:GYF domain-containing protein n=1 Tax=Fuerstiella marisgermanici TaxID=1891926 RepID=A0A1P8WLK0_9PLAN|nr:hypothetical protein [Fuerstiella marisgermanici]APZ94924.1 hypothetical protein Fuma_04575 [Fuerstiella marisgermanici]